MEVCGFCGRLSANCPVGRDTAGERRQTEGMGCARTGSALLASSFTHVTALLTSLAPWSFSDSWPLGHRGLGRSSEVGQTLGWHYWVYSCFLVPEASVLICRATLRGDLRSVPEGRRWGYGQ